MNGERTVRTVQLARNELHTVACAELRIYGPYAHPALKGKHDDSLAFHATKLAELLMPFDDGYGCRAEIIFDGRFCAIKIVNVTVDIERPGL